MVFRERFWGTVLRMKHSRQKWTGYLLFDAAFRPSFVARLRLSPRLGRIFFKKQTSNQLNDQLVIAICDLKIYRIYQYSHSIEKYELRQGGKNTPAFSAGVSALVKSDYSAG